MKEESFLKSIITVLEKEYKLYEDINTVVGIKIIENRPMINFKDIYRQICSFSDHKPKKYKVKAIIQNI